MQKFKFDFFFIEMNADEWLYVANFCGSAELLALSRTCQELWYVLSRTRAIILYRVIVENRGRVEYQNLLLYMGKVRLCEPYQIPTNSRQMIKHWIVIRNISKLTLLRYLSNICNFRCVNLKPSYVANFRKSGF